MRKARFELANLTAPEPKSGASTIFAISAGFYSDNIYCSGYDEI